MTDSPRSTNLTWLLIATILGSSMAFIDYSVANVALPVLQKELSATLAQAQWVVEIYILFVASLILVGGSLGDRFGRKRVYVIGIVTFACASIFCGLAATANQLIVARAFQGVGGALLIPGSLSLLRAHFGERESGKAIGTWSGFSALMSVVGPLLGGFLIEYVSWRWIFYINIPIAIATLVILYLYVGESRSDEQGGLDYIGAVLETIGLGLVVYGLIKAGHAGLMDPEAVATFSGGIVLLLIFIVHEARTTTPMMPLFLFRSSTFTGVNLLTLLLYGALTGSMFFTQFALLQVQGYTPLMAGAVFAPFAILMFFFSRHAGRLATTTGPRLPLTIGPLLTALGMLLFTRAGREADYWTTYFPAILVMGSGMTLVVAPLTATAMGCVEEKYAGLASGVNNAVSRTGGLLAIAVMGIIMQISFNANLESRLDGIDLAPRTRAALDAERVKLAAAEIPAGLEPERREVVQTAIFDAFIDGYHQMLRVCALITLVGTAMAFFMIRSKPKSAGTPVA